MQHANTLGLTIALGHIAWRLWQTAMSSYFVELRGHSPGALCYEFTTSLCDVVETCISTLPLYSTINAESSPT
ncbi:hypothetical protein GGR57DRAFT_448953 [Xylariaceae sp. FL1272]|nr:hypothetical protein GGR57DRAFT_448953 [Xylariaceae sp. FL1272]